MIGRTNLNRLLKTRTGSKEIPAFGRQKTAVGCTQNTPESNSNRLDIPGNLFTTSRQEYQRSSRFHELGPIRNGSTPAARKRFTSNKSEYARFGDQHRCLIRIKEFNEWTSQFLSSIFSVIILDSNVTSSSFLNRPTKCQPLAGCDGE